MPRRIALLCCAGLLALAAPAAHAKPADDACRQASPNASACIGMDKVAEAAAAVCRGEGVPDSACVLPAGHDVTQSELQAYQASWAHRAAQLQYGLGNSVPLGDAQWLGTHNSFNTDADGVTASHTDNNQQLTLTQQLDGDIRALELDVHFVPGTENGGADVVRVCHGRGPDQYHAGCTTEPPLSAVLPEIDTWLTAHPGQVILLYLEDELGDPVGYSETVSALDGALVAPDGRSLLYRPDPARIGSSGCENLPLGVSRDDVRAAGAQVVLVGNCRSGWSSDVFGWDANHVESGSTPDYKPYPTCDATYAPAVYADHFVRYFEDSTWLSAAIDPSETPADADAGALTPAKVTSMVDCGVNLFGFDQFLPDDGRVAASIWSWAQDQPNAGAGACAVQRSDGRWASADCATPRPAACRTASDGWVLSAPAPAAGAAEACRDRGATFSEPRTGPENEQLRVIAGSADVLLDQRSA